MRPLLLALAAVSLAAGGPPQEDSETASVRYREIPGVLAAVASAADQAAGDDGKALVLWLVDNSSALRATRHDQLLGRGIARAFEKQRPGVHHSVMAFADPPRVLLEPTRETAAVARALEALGDDKPDNRIKDCLETVRTAAKAAAGFRGRRLVVLFTPENGDNEDGVEETLALLKRSGVALHVIAPEAVYSDPFWEAAAGSADAERLKKLGVEMKGPESAFIEFPYAWALTNGTLAYTVPSGFPHWALGRLAANTGGRCYLYSPESITEGFCDRFGCRVCGGEHRGCGAAFDVTKLRMTAPSIAPRDKVREQLGKDRLAVALYAAWERMSKAGLMSAPPLIPSAGGLAAAAKAPPAKGRGLMPGTRWKANAASAKDLAAETGRAIADLEKEIAAAPAATELRTKATADALLLHLRFLRFNLDQLRLFSERMEELETKGHDHEKGFGGDGPGRCCKDGSWLGWHFATAHLCHGGASLKDLGVLGGAAGRQALRDLLDAADAVMERHRGTPWEVLARRASIALFYPIEGD